MIENTEIFYPGAASMEGFLSPGQELAGVIERDTKVVELLGYQHAEVAELLRGVVDAGANVGYNQIGQYRTPSGLLLLKTISYRGQQACPFDGRFYSHSNKDVFVARPGKEEELRMHRSKSGQGVIRIAGMLPTLIAEHEFYEGGPYRVAPEDIIELFGEVRDPEVLVYIRQDDAFRI